MGRMPGNRIGAKFISAFALESKREKLLSFLRGILEILKFARSKRDFNAGLQQRLFERSSPEMK